MVMHVELQATCSALGYQEGNQYVKEPDCLETVKDLIRFLKREDEYCDIRRQLGDAQLVQNDLIPLVKQYTGKEDSSLWDTIIRLLVNLSQPAILCWRGELPEEKSQMNYYLEVVAHLQAMKEAFANEEFWAVITDKLGELLKLDWEHRHEEDRLLIERLLILIRNILHVPPDPAAEQRTDDDASIHDQVVWAMHVSGLEDILLYIGSSDEERNLSMHILEIVSLMFREQTPEVLASAGIQRSVTEKQKDERELEMVREQERLQKKANTMKFSTRHSRFGGTFVVKNMKSISDNDLIYHRSQADVSKIDLDMDKKPKKKAKNRKPIIDNEIVRRSTLSIRLSLKEFCVQFLENCYNPLMYAVKDVLNHQKSQEHDETYYLWAMRFFMEFCRLHTKQVDLVGETLSVPTFHYIQVQLYQYYEMQQMEKKEAIVWGKRVHLALKAYQELLLTLDSMDRSTNTSLMESSKVIKSNVFYVMEFRDIFLTLLRRFEEKRQSREYLRDLIETTHLFLKMLEQFSKTGHLVVQNKKKKGGRKKKPKTTAGRGPTEPSEQELEDLWDEVSGDLSAIFQGRADLPDAMAPFDAASEVDVDQQRADAMIRIQDSLRGKEPGKAVALFRAAREVWPERNEFGTAEIAPEDEFMALREIFMTNLPRLNTEIPDETEEQYGVENEVEEEEIPTFATSEQEFVFSSFVNKFAKPDIMKACVLLLADFQKNTTHTNHCCVKLLHRIAFDLQGVGMLYQASLFRVFQRILLSPLAKAARYKEIVKFATHIVRQFVETAQRNPKAVMELLFWKSPNDAMEVIEGYGSYQSKGKVAWSEDAEMEVHRLFDEYNIQEHEGQDTVDCIMDRITDPSKTRGQIIRELKRQELITTAKDLKKPKGGGSRAGPWREEDELELTELWGKYKDTPDPVGAIIGELCKKRSRSKVMEKIVSLGLVSDRRELFKKRGGKSGGGRARKAGSDSDSDGIVDDAGELGSDIEADLPGFSSGSDVSRDSATSGPDTDDDDACGGGEVAEETTTGGATMADVIKGLVDKGYKDQIGWTQRILSRTAGDREDGDDVAVPIVPLTEENETAMEDDVFLSFMAKIGMTAPSNEQEAFWRIPWELSARDLRTIVEGLALDGNDNPIAADKITMKMPQRTKTKEKRKRKEKTDRKKDKRPKKKSNPKFDKLRELVKKQSEAKKTKRVRKKAAPVSGGSDSDSDADDDAPLRTPARQEVPDPRLSSSGKKGRIKRVLDSDSDSDSDADNGAPLRTPARQEVPDPRQSSSGKKGRIRRVLDSDSESSDDDRLVIADRAGNQSDSDAAMMSEGANQSQSPTSPRPTEQTNSQGSPGPVSASQSDDGASQQPLLFMSDSDSDLDNAPKTATADGNKLAENGSQASKRSRSEDSELEGSARRVQKKARILDSDDDEEPVSAMESETFPATLYTQGPDSDSDLDDHVPLRKVIQRRNVIESDEDD